jgi:release factor glutamine methyltransferase
MPDPVTVRRALAQASLAPIDAQVLLAHVLRRDRGWLIAHATDTLDRADADAFAKLARRRRDGEPVAYLTGTREFWGLPLVVDQSVLIPRPETEALVELALRKLPPETALDVLDLGTGSGAIALAINRERPHAAVVATDCSDAALAIAGENARRLGVAGVRFIAADWFAGLDESLRFDLIAANPPYVAAGDPHLLDGDLRFEPPAALVAGADGLDALRTIIAGAPARLRSGGWLVVEHGFDQAQRAAALLEQAGFAGIESARDLSGIPRVAAGRLAAHR